MPAQALTKTPGTIPALFDDFFKPWNEWFGTMATPLNRMMSVPAVNIVEREDEYQLLFAVPGLKKEDFRIDVNNNILTVSSEKEETNEEKDKKFTRREYSYSSFSRSFTLPEDINKEKIEARYLDGQLKLFLPRRDEGKKVLAKKIDVK